jgi:hypothetical protein
MEKKLFKIYISKFSTYERDYLIYCEDIIEADKYARELVREKENYTIIEIKVNENETKSR